MRYLLIILLLLCSFGVNAQSVKDPYLHYSFDNTLIDSALTGIDLLKYGTVAFSTVEKKTGTHSMYFSASSSSDYLSIPKNDLGDEFWVSFWAWSPQLTFSTARYLLSNANPYTSDSSWRMVVLTDSKIKAYAGLDGIGSGATWINGQWNHYATYYNTTSDSCISWLNGTRTGAVKIATNFDTNDSIYIGTDIYKNLRWKGYIDELRIYKDFKPTQAQIDSVVNLLYINGSVPPTPATAGRLIGINYIKRKIIQPGGYKGFRLASPPPVSTEDVIDRILAINFEEFATGAFPYDTFMNHVQVWQLAWANANQSIIDLNDGSHEKVWHSRVLEGQMGGDSGFGIFLLLDKGYEEIWVDVDVRVMPGFDGEGQGGSGYHSGKLPTGGAFGGLHYYHRGDSTYTDPEDYGAWWAHTVWGADEYLYHYAYSLSGTRQASGNMGKMPIDWKHYSTRIRVNDPGVANGVKEVFGDGTYISGMYDLKMRAVAQGEDYGLIEAVKLSFFFGGDGDGFKSTQNQWIEVDNIVVSTASSGTRKKVGVYEAGDQIIYNISSDNLQIDSILYCEDFTTNTGTAQSHYNVNWPPNSPRVYQKTITVTEGQHVDIDFDYYRDDYDYGDNSWTKIYSGTGSGKTLLYTWGVDYTWPNTSTTYHVSDNEVTIEYYMGKNFGESKGWKLTWEAVAP